MNNKKVVRCKVCGKPVNGNHDDCEPRSVRIEVGEVNGDDGVVEFTKDSPAWGYMHHRCFLLAIGAPLI